MQPWLDRGYTVEFWADVFGDHPELMDKVPAGAIPVVWQYDSPAPAGRGRRRRTAGQVAGVAQPRASTSTALRDGFRDRAKLLLEAGIPFWVAPGTSSWNSLLGRWDNALANMVDAAEVGLENSAQGYLNTAWGDHGHWDPPSVAFGPGPLRRRGVLVAGGQPRPRRRRRPLRAALLMDPTGTTGDVLVRTGPVTAQLGAPLLNASPLCLRPARAGPPAAVGGPRARGAGRGARRR